MTSIIVILFFKLIEWAAFGFLYLIIGYIVLLPLIVPYTTYRTKQRWLKWETLEQYWATHPDCKTRDGSKCFHCGSRNIRQYGFEEGKQNTKKLHQCNQCNTWLYRSGTKE